MNLNDFHFLVGQTIMYCQIIEHDVKHIYASMLSGDYFDNLDKVEKWTLGKAVLELKKLDFQTNDHYISASDYNFLKQMSEKRNHWCHEAYLKFVYIDESMSSKEYITECKRLQKDNERLFSVFKALEKVRIQAQKDFNRM